MAMYRRLQHCGLLVTVLFTICAVLICGDHANASPEATIALAIEPYMALVIEKDDLSIEITAADIAFEGVIEKKDSTRVTVFANIDVILRAPFSIILSRVGGAEEQTTTVVIDVESSGGTPLPSDFTPPGFKQLLLPMGAYTDTPETRPSVDVSATKIWSIDDIAGVYIGTLVLDLIPAP